jgi:cytidine deaminase
MHAEAVQRLIEAALRARESAYAPYSRFRVGAAVLAEEQIFTGCNVENASFGLTICAERAAVFAAVAAGAREIRALAVATENGGTPCGACRQVLAEFAPKDGAPLRVLVANAATGGVRETTLAALLPEAFGAEARG